MFQNKSWIDCTNHQASWSEKWKTGAEITVSLQLLFKIPDTFLLAAGENIDPGPTWQHHKRLTDSNLSPHLSEWKHR